MATTQIEITDSAIITNLGDGMKANEVEKKIDQLLGALSLEEKAAQLMVWGYSGVFIEPQLVEFVSKYGLGGLKVSPVLARKFVRYLPDGSPALKNIERDPTPQEKLFDISVPPPHVTVEEYAQLLNQLRKIAFDRKHPLPLHMVIDYESGEGASYLPKGAITAPAQMGLGRLDDTDLTKKVAEVIGRQLKSMGLDMILSPVVDVNTNPGNAEINTRSYGSDPELVAKHAKAALEGFKNAGVIGCLKHFPGIGDSTDDSHTGNSIVEADRSKMKGTHIAPYKTLCDQKIVPAIIPAHSIYPALDSSKEVATVSKTIIGDILRKELGFDGVVVSDSLTMGGLSTKYNVKEAAVRALDAGVDMLLLKGENALRFELHQAIVDAVKSKRIKEARIDESLSRIWRLKMEYGLFENGGIVDVDGIDDVMWSSQNRKVAREASERVIHTLRDEKKLLPLDKGKTILIVDRITGNQLAHNDIWNHPGMFWEFMLNYSPNIGYVDYAPDSLDETMKKVKSVVDNFEMIVATAHFSRGLSPKAKNFLADLSKLGKPVVLVTTNPSEELVVPKEIGTVVVSYGLMHDNLEAVGRYLFEKH